MATVCSLITTNFSGQIQRASEAANAVLIAATIPSKPDGKRKAACRVRFSTDISVAQLRAYLRRVEGYQSIKRMNLGGLQECELSEFILLYVVWCLQPIQNSMG
jgi:hypothetical protein